MLYELFEKYGKIKKLSIVKTFAFVTYFNNDDAQNAKYNLDNYLLDNKNIKIDYAVSSCYYCGDKSHDSKECPEKNGDNNKPNTKCYFCKGDWHPRRECPEKDKDRKHLEKNEWNKHTSGNNSRSRSRDRFRDRRNSRSRSRSRSKMNHSRSRSRSRGRDRDNFNKPVGGKKMFDDKMLAACTSLYFISLFLLMKYLVILNSLVLMLLKILFTNYLLNTVILAK